MIAAVVDDDLEAAAEMLEPGDDLGLVEIVGDDTNLRQGIGDGLIEEVENGAARFEAHPIKGIGGFGMSGSEAKALLGFRREQGCEGLIRIIAAIAIDEGLGDDKTASEGDIELSGIGFAMEFDGCLLELAIAEFVEAVHKHGRNAIDEGPGQIREAREVDPTELLNGGKPC